MHYEGAGQEEGPLDAGGLSTGRSEHVRRSHDRLPHNNRRSDAQDHVLQHIHSIYLRRDSFSTFGTEKQTARYERASHSSSGAGTFVGWIQLRTKRFNLF